MRYFLFAYRIFTPSGIELIGNCLMAQPTFPTQEAIKTYITDKATNTFCYNVKKENIIILSIFEFKNKEDYIAFNDYK